MRRLAMVIGVSLALAVSGGATAAVFSQSSPSPKATPKKSAPTEARPGETEEAGIHGGPIDRFHNGGACNLVDVSKLSGNWTHGDYVSAVAQAGDPSLVPQAAHSDCGKPMVAVNHGSRPASSLSAVHRHASPGALIAIHEEAVGHAAGAAERPASG